MLKRWFAFIYGVACYAVFFVTFLYAIGFVGNIGVPRSIDSEPTGDFRTSLGIDLALLALFAVQHSGMARTGFKRWLTRFVAQPIERSRLALRTSTTTTATAMRVSTIVKPVPAASEKAAPELRAMSR